MAPGENELDTPALDTVGVASTLDDSDLASSSAAQVEPL